MLTKIIIVLLLLAFLFGPWGKRAKTDQGIKILLGILIAIMALSLVVNLLRG